MNGENAQPCAACKHERKMCGQSCEMAPYFPSSRYAEYLNAHKLFGTNNIIKIMNAAETHQKKDAAASILAEANAWRKDPVHGCLGIVRNLVADIEFYQSRLGAVNQQLDYYRAKEPVGEVPTISSLTQWPWQNEKVDGFHYEMPASKDPNELNGLDYKMPDLQDPPFVGDTNIRDQGNNEGPNLEEEANASLISRAGEQASELDGDKEGKEQASSLMHED